MRSTLPILLVAILWPHPALADEKHVFLGRTADGWLSVLRDQTSKKGDRLEAIRALGCFGPEARAAVPDLVDALNREETRVVATDALVQIGAAIPQTVPLLIERFVKEGCDQFTSRGAIAFNPKVRNLLVNIGRPAVPALVDVVKGPNPAMRVCAAEALGAIGPAASAAVPALIRVIERPDSEVTAEILTHHAAKALGRIGPQAKAAVPALTRLLGTEAYKEVGSTQFDLVLALARIGAPPIQMLLDVFLGSGKSFVAHELGWLGTNASAAIPRLREALTDKRPQVRIVAAVALAHIEPSDLSPVPVLVDAIKYFDDENSELDLSLVPSALALFGSRAKTALPALTRLIEQGGGYSDAVKALVHIDPQGTVCVPALISALKRDEIEVADVAARCLGLLGPSAKSAVPALCVAMTGAFPVEFYNEYDPQVSAAKAIRRIGPAAKTAIPTLIAALKFRYDQTRPFGDRNLGGEYNAAAAAAQVLGSFGADAKAAVPALIQAVQTREKDDANWPVRQAAALALGQIGPDARAAIPALRDMLKENAADTEALAELMVALYRLAPEGKDLAEAWLAKPMTVRTERDLLNTLQNRALVVGAMGRASVEADWWTKSYLGWLTWAIQDENPRANEQIESYESWFEDIGRLKSAGRLAIPRLNELHKHKSPFVRMWATEALEQIKPSSGQKN
jgi:HEAT repeat protein